MTSTMNKVKLPEWYTTVSHNLSLLEEFAKTTSDEDDVVPPPETFQRVKEFLDLMRDRLGDSQGTAPKLFDANGTILLKFGEKTRTLNIEFTTQDLTYLLKNPESGYSKGTNPVDAIQLIADHFLLR